MNGTWITTYSGIHFYPLDPREDDIKIRDIAHSLSNICRYMGHVERHYSVAQHSWLGSQLCEEDLAGWFLLHDAPEAYLNDIVAPLKCLFPGYVDAENRLMEMIAVKYGLPLPIPKDRIKEVDRRMVATERRDLMRVLKTEHDHDPYLVTIDFMVPETAEALFLRRFAELFDSKSANW